MGSDDHGSVSGHTLGFVGAGSVTDLSLLLRGGIFMHKKVSLAVVAVAVLLSVSGTVLAVSQTDVIGKIQQIFDSSTQTEAEKKLAEINTTINQMTNDAIAEVQLEVDNNKLDANKQIDEYVKAKLDDYKKQVDQIKANQKQQVQEKKQEAVDKQKVNIDNQFSQYESALYQSLNDRLN